MSRKGMNILLGVASLVLGALIYIIFRENTYVAKLFNESEMVLWLRTYLSKYANDFIRYYLPDFFWAYSLCCGLILIFEPNKSGVILCAIVSVIYGGVWELLQYLGCIKGTGDCVDVVMYLLAGFASITINLKERKR